MRLPVSVPLQALAAVILSLPASAQVVVGHDADGSAQTRIPGITVFSDPNAPFFGSDTIQWLRPGADGSSVTKYVTARIARDAQGRLYRERHHFVPAGVDPATSLFEFSIADPTTRSLTVCSVRKHRCVARSYVPPVAASPSAAEVLDQGRRTRTRDALGRQMIDGIFVEGTRETISIEPGADGNDKLLRLTNEFWYSPELKTNVLVIRNNPRNGKVTVALKVDSRTDPDPAMFKVPAAYVVYDMRSVRVRPSAAGTSGDAALCGPERIDCHFPGK